MFSMDIILIILVLLFASPAVTGAGIYIVGDSAGWTTIGNVDYRQWAATKKFQVGDTIRFHYNPEFHNVMQVTHSHFRSCNTSHPIATHTSGNDSILITSSGHHFYLCGVPGHCQSGQKVDINIVNRAPIVSSPSNIPPSSPAVAPAPSGAATFTRPVLSLQGLLIGVGLLMVLIFL
ncbi:mavicyanin-like [Impatiens glandulifera]|uniref:mavicyanin-like n=1 Tax=Impatiens glandulifera TaxID=253017 RepID=UPI001FB10861|nr:mavicyanin-like [Impatiens glandulifera]